LGRYVDVQRFVFYLCGHSIHPGSRWQRALIENAAPFFCGALLAGAFLRDLTAYDESIAECIDFQIFTGESRYRYAYLVAIRLFRYHAFSRKQQLLFRTKPVVEVAPISISALLKELVSATTYVFNQSVEPFAQCGG